MNEPTKAAGNTATFLLTKEVKQVELPDGRRVKVVIAGCTRAGVAAGVAILFKKLACELVLIDADETLAKAEAEDMGHAAAFFGNAKITASKDYTSARDATVCVIFFELDEQNENNSADLLEQTVKHFKTVVPGICKFAPNSVLLIVSPFVDIASYVTMKISGFSPNRVIGLGTFLDSCRFQYYIAQKLGISPSLVQGFVIGSSGPDSVPVWSAVSVTGVKLRDINKDIGLKKDPEHWNEVHEQVVNANDDLISRKGHSSWGIGICVSEIVEAIVRNTGACITVSTFIKGCRHGLEKDFYMSLPCIVGSNGVQSYIRHLYTLEEQELTTKSSQSIYEIQKSVLDLLES